MIAKTKNDTDKTILGKINFLRQDAGVVAAIEKAFRKGGAGYELYERTLD
jgi:hypothetical protein